MLANGRRRFARAIVTRRAETGPGLREGLQPCVERGRPWPARPFATPVSVGYRWPGDLVLMYSQVLAACRAGETIEGHKKRPAGGQSVGSRLRVIASGAFEAFKRR